MLNLFLSKSARKLNALLQSQASIEFDVSGNIISANQQFLNLMEYTLAEIKGKHHSMFIDPAYANSREYEYFWSLLKQGSLRARNLNASPRVAKPYGCKQVITRYWIVLASLSE